MIVSHFNASVSAGIVILNDVILPGLQMLDDDAVSWAIEIHGNSDENAADIDEAVEEEDEEDEEDNASKEDEKDALDYHEDRNSNGVDSECEFNTQETEENRNESCDDKSDAYSSLQSLGPAVYIIKKQKATSDRQNAITIEYHSY